MQWASSTVTKHTLMCRSLVQNSSDDSRSGDTYKILTAPKTQFSSVARISSWVSPVCMAAAAMLRRLRFITWSFMRAMSGVITMHTPVMVSAGTWNVIDLPPPVGMSPSVSRPLLMLSIISRCMPRKPA